jgi:hypothetical protein
MDNMLNISVTSTQVLLALIFQMWIIVFPIIIIIKLNRLTRMLEERFGTDEEDQHV